LERVEQTAGRWPVNTMPATLADRTKRVYDSLAGVYPMSTFFFHSRAHRCALASSGLTDGMNVLEVATGSGEMFRRLVAANRAGTTVGVDLSPNMAARAQRTTRRKYPQASAHCQAVDARHMPFRNGAFDIVFCCYLLELLSTEDIVRTLSEFRRVLRDRGHLALVLIGQNVAGFNKAYRLAGTLAPAFWGRQVEQRVPELIASASFEILDDRQVRQGWYPSRILVARK